jgi:hypothetical protein
VAESLKAAHPGQQIEFLNAALGGFCTFESMGRLWARLRFYKPDVVVVNHGWNELYYWKAKRMDEPTNWRRLDDGGWSLTRYQAKNPIVSPLAIDSLSQWSQLLVRIRIRLSPRITGEAGGAETDGLLDHYDPRGADVWREHLQLIAFTTELMGAELFVAKQSTLVVPGLSEELRERCQYSHHGFDHDAHLAAYENLYRVIDEELSPEQIIDLTPLSGRGDLFTDHVHPNPLGAKAIAEITTEVLLERSKALGRR